MYPLSWGLITGLIATVNSGLSVIPTRSSSRPGTQVAVTRPQS